jgi:hypothetical protein
MHDCWTGGLHVCIEGNHMGKFALDTIKKTRENKDKEASDKVKKKLKERQELKRKVVASLAKGGLHQQWKAINLKHIVQWYNSNGDPTLPKNRQGFLDQYEKTKHLNVVDVNLDAIIDTSEDKNHPAATDNVDASPIPSPTPNQTALINNEPLPVEMVEETSLLEAEAEAEAEASAEDLNDIQINDDAMAINLLFS